MDDLPPSWVEFRSAGALGERLHEGLPIEQPTLGDDRFDSAGVGDVLAWVCGKKNEVRLRSDLDSAELMASLSAGTAPAP